MDRQLLGWELGGIVPIMLVGSLLHFAFAWSNQWASIAVVAAVNESVWEHLKLAFWPMLGWALVVRRFLDTPSGAFWAATSIGLLIASTSIVAVFFTYVAILGRNVLILDLATYALSVILGQVASAVLVSVTSAILLLRRAALVLLAVQLVAFSALTYFPPQWELFRDPRDGSYGIPTSGVPNGRVHRALYD
jgi:hypothetical protein